EKDVGEGGMGAKVAAIDVAGHPAGVLRADEAGGGRHLQQYGWARRHHQRPGGGGAENQAPASLGVGARELLRGGAAPGDAQRVALPMSKVLQDLRSQEGNVPEPVG